MYAIRSYYGSDHQVDVAASQSGYEIVVRTLDRGDIEIGMRLEEPCNGPRHNNRADERQSADDT